MGQNALYRWHRSHIKNKTKTKKPNTIMKTIARIGAALAFTFCLLAGVWILTKTGFSRSSDDSVVWTGLGLYFVGKAFFVGPMLWLAGEKCCSESDSK